MSVKNRIGIVLMVYAVVCDLEGHMPPHIEEYHAGIGWITFSLTLFAVGAAMFCWRGRGAA